MVVRYPVLLACVCFTVRAAAPSKETSAAFDRYVKITEDGFAKHLAPGNFLWLDDHAKEKSLVWLGQSVVVPVQTLDQGKPIEVPDGLVQHWLGAAYAEGMDVGNVSRMLLNFPPYKDFFKAQIMESKLIKQQGDQNEILLRFYKKQVSTVVLNMSATTKYTVLDPTRWTLTLHSTHIGEVEHPKNKKKLDEERPVESTAGYLWRLNIYFRVQQSDNGVYIEVEVISLAREPGRISPSRFLNGFQDFPHELTAGIVDTMTTIFPHPKRK